MGRDETDSVSLRFHSTNLDTRGQIMPMSEETFPQCLPGPVCCSYHTRGRPSAVVFAHILCATPRSISRGGSQPQHSSPLYLVRPGAMLQWLGSLLHTVTDKETALVTLFTKLLHTTKSLTKVKQLKSGN